MQMSFKNGAAMAGSDAHAVTVTDMGVFFGAPYSEARAVNNEGACFHTVAHGYGVLSGLVGRQYASVPERWQPRQSRAA